MLTRLTLENFKAFADEQQIPLKPITLVFGANSSGKSSILHALLLAKEAIKEGGNLNADRTEAGGDSVDLGGFLNYVNSHNTERDVRMAFEMTAPARANGRQDDILSRARRVAIDFAFGFDSRRQITIPRRYEVLLDAMTAMVLFYSGGEEEMEQQQPIAARQINLDHPLVREVCEAVLLSAGSPSERQRDALVDIVNNLVPLVRGAPDPFLPTVMTVERLPVGAVAEAMSKMLVGDDPESLIRFMLRWSLLPSLIFGARQQLADELSRLIYLGPLRAYPPRFLMRTQRRDTLGESTGLNAWQALFSDGEARAKVNEWLGSEKLRTPYEIAVERLRSAGTSRPEVQAISDLLDDIASNPVGWEMFSEEPIALLKELSPAGYYELVVHEIKERLVRAEWEKQIEDSGFESVKDASAKMALADSMEKRIQELEFDLDLDDPDWQNIVSYVEHELRVDLVGEKLVEVRNRLITQPHPADIEQLVILDKQADNMRVTHRDIGMGISQVLPVLVNAIAPRNSLVMIEQPEIHIHPALQAELGDVFIESALRERKNRFILETHSEHLILRIMRRMRETADGENQDLPPVTPDDVAVLYVEREGGRSIVREMRLDEEGQLIDHWPGGFFEEDFREKFS